MPTFPTSPGLSRACFPSIPSYLQFSKHTMPSSCLHLFPLDYLFYIMGYHCLFICLVNFSYVDSASRLSLQRSSLWPLWAEFDDSSLVFPFYSQCFLYFHTIWCIFETNDTQNSMCQRIFSATCKNSKLWVLASEVLIYWIRIKTELFYIYEIPRYIWCITTF